MIRSATAFITPLSRLLLLIGLGAAASITPAGGQAIATAIPPISDTTLARISEEVTIPPGFAMSVFAAPPHLTYPTVVQPAGDGVVYAATDPNLLFGQERFLGRILRFVDEDRDGIADRYTVFVDSLDAVRGLALDGETVYAMHAPTLTAYRDTDGDGIADERRDLVTGLGFGLEDRIGDHTVNGIRLGADGWLYIAVGDYGFLAATGADGTQLALHAGGILRVRTDGTELELVARGTRNIYDLALDSHLRIFTRDNNNNGQGWNNVLHHLPYGAEAGYPSLFRHFLAETHPPMADYGAGAASTTLWVEEAGFPTPFSRALLSADWALNEVYRHDLTPVGGTFEITQEAVMEIPRPIDLEVSPEQELFVASLSGGSYEYAGEHVGYILRLVPEGSTLPPPVTSLNETEVIAALLGDSHARRWAAQRELLGRGLTHTTQRQLAAAVENPALPVEARVTAIFTLGEALGDDAHAILLHLTENDDPRLREAALRTLADRMGESSRVPAAPFVEALADPDRLVRVQAVRGLARLAPYDGAEHLMRAAVDTDGTVAHVARRAVVALGDPGASAALRTLDNGGDADRAAALEVLSRIHSPVVVGALAGRLAAAQGEAERLGLAAALGRLMHREGYWDGSWWGNQPNTEGPYFNPMRWEASARIEALLLEAIRETPDGAMAPLLERLEREAVLPRNSAGLLAMRRSLGGPVHDEMLTALVGYRELTAEGIAALTEIFDRHPAARRAVADVAVSPLQPPAASAALLQRIATQKELPAELRSRALIALTHLPSSLDPAAAATAYAHVIAELADEPALLQAWRRYTTEARRQEEFEHHLVATQSTSAAQRTLGYAVLLQLAARPRTPDELRVRAEAAIEAANGERADDLDRARELLGR